MRVHREHRPGGSVNRECNLDEARRAGQVGERTKMRTSAREDDEEGRTRSDETTEQQGATVRTRSSTLGPTVHHERPSSDDTVLSRGSMGDKKGRGHCGTTLPRKARTRYRLRDRRERYSVGQARGKRDRHRHIERSNSPRKREKRHGRERKIRKNESGSDGLPGQAVQSSMRKQCITSP